MNDECLTQGAPVGQSASQSSQSASQFGEHEAGPDNSCCCTGPYFDDYNELLLYDSSKTPRSLRRTKIFAAVRRDGKKRF